MANDVEREVSIDTNLVIKLFGAADFSADRLAEALSCRNLRLVVPEMSLAQALAYHNVDKAFERTCNVAALARAAGRLFAIAAPIYRIREEELSGTEIPSTPLFTDDYQEGILAAANSRSEFQEWQAALHSETREHLDADGWLQKDQNAKAALQARFAHLDTPRKRADELRALLPLIPQDLANNWFLSWFVSEEANRVRIGASPQQFPSIVCLALALTVNGIGAAMDLQGHHEFDYLRAARDSWTDARILCASVYADLFTTDDQDLADRARLIASWGYFRPTVTTWDGLMQLA